MLMVQGVLYKLQSQKYCELDPTSRRSGYPL
jgi:hypothetical protein